MLRPKKNLKKEFGNEKNTCDSKIPPPPPHNPRHNFSNGPSPRVVWRREREARNTQ